MIKINLYKNGFEIVGHTNPVTCGEISILSWACANSVYKVDETSVFKDNFNGIRKNDGYSKLIFDTENEKAVYLFEEFKHNLEVWSGKVWDKRDYEIKNKEQILTK